MEFLKNSDSLLKSFDSFHCLKGEVHISYHNYKTT